MNRNQKLRKMYELKLKSNVKVHLKKLGITLQGGQEYSQKYLEQLYLLQVPYVEKKEEKNGNEKRVEKVHRKPRNN